jgi:hypothetical protein
VPTVRHPTQSFSTTQRAGGFGTTTLSGKKGGSTFQHLPKPGLAGKQPRVARPPPLPTLPQQTSPSAPLTTVGDPPEKSPPSITRQRRGSTFPLPCGELLEGAPVTARLGVASAEFLSKLGTLAYVPFAWPWVDHSASGQRGETAADPSPTRVQGPADLAFSWPTPRGLDYRRNLWAFARSSVSPLYSRAHYAKGTAGRESFRCHLRQSDEDWANSNFFKFG